MNSALMNLVLNTEGIQELFGKKVFHLENSMAKCMNRLDELNDGVAPGVPWKNGPVYSR